VLSYLKVEETATQNARLLDKDNWLGDAA